MTDQHSLTSEELATPKTDAASFLSNDARGVECVRASFARAQERRIAEIEDWLDRLLPSWRESEARDYEEALVTSQRRQIAELEAKCERLIQTAMARGDR